MGRLVFAVPGSPLDPRASGTNTLLKNGAIMLTEAQDIRDALAPMLRKDGTAPQQAGFVFTEDSAQILAQTAPLSLETSNSQPNGSADLASTDLNCTDIERIRNALSSTPASVDAIIRHTALTPSAVHLALLELDLSGQLQRSSDGLIALLPS